MSYILLHGLGQTSSSWNETIQILNEDWNIFCPDLSDWIIGKQPCYDTLYKAFEKYCEQFDDTLCLVGLSLGGILAMQYSMSNTVKRKLQRISKLDEATDTYTAAAFLIAQLGKNYTNQMNERISGEELLDMAWTVVKELQYAAGGMVSFLEADKKEKLLEFYNKNGFREFDVKMVEDSEGNEHELVQLLRLM